MTDLAAGRFGAATKRLPPGFGILAGAAVSLGLWAGLFWLAGVVW